MSVYYDISGNPVTVGGDVEKDALMIDVNNLVSLQSERIMKLEGMHEAFLLPVLRLTGDTSKMTKDKAVTLDAEFTDGVRSFKCKAKTKWQGQSSLNFPKKNYSIKLIDGNGNKEIMAFKDWFPTNSYHLKANYDDYSMVRNVVGVRIGRDIYPNLYPNNARGVIDSFPFILYINDEWWGCYTWNLSQSADLFAMDETNLNHMVFRPDNTGWEVENFEDRLHDDPISSQIEKLTRMVNWTKTCTNAEFVSDINDYFDLKSLEYYWLYMDIGCAGDSMVNNSTWASWDGEKWYVLWYDLDIIFGWNQTLYTPTIDLIALSKTSEWSHKYNPVWDKLYTSFYNDLCDIYAELRENAFTDAATIIKYFTDYRDQWGQENVTHEYQKWSGKSNSAWDISNCAQWITQRLAYCDNKYGYNP